MSLNEIKYTNLGVYYNGNRLITDVEEGNSVHINTGFPTNSDDNTLGFRIGDIWFDKSSKIYFLLEDDSTNNAIWIKTTQVKDFSTLQTGHGFLLGEAIFFNQITSEFELARADNFNTLGRFIVSKVLDADNFLYTNQEVINWPSHGFDIGAILYNSDFIQGLLTDVKPSNEGSFVQAMAVVLDADNILPIISTPTEIEPEKWSLNVSDLYYNLGNVGIGTDTPTEKLEVKGKIKIGNLTPYTLPDVDGLASQILKTDGLGGAFWDTLSAGNPAGNNTEIQFNNAGAFGSSPNLVWDNTLNNLSVGSGAASTALSVQGFATIQNQINIDGTWTQFQAIQPNTNLEFKTVAGTGKVTFSPNGSVNPALVIDSNSNIGISLNSPTASLHIKAGSSVAGTAPIKLTAGVNLTSPEEGVLEFDGNNLTYTDDNPIRQTLIPAAYGEMFENNNAGTTINLATINTYYGWTTATSGDGYLTSFVDNDTADRITISSGGEGAYIINLQGSLSMGTQNNIYFASIFKNGVLIDKAGSIFRVNNTGLYVNFAITVVETGLVAGDYFDVRFSNNSANNRDIIIYKINFTMSRLRK